MFFHDSRVLIKNKLEFRNKKCSEIIFKSQLKICIHLFPIKKLHKNKQAIKKRGWMKLREIFYRQELKTDMKNKLQILTGRKKKPESKIQAYRN